MTFLLNGRIIYQCGRELEWLYYNATSIYAAVKESCSRLPRGLISKSSILVFSEPLAVRWAPLQSAFHLRFFAHHFC
jgi:hypothetical protein